MIEETLAILKPDATRHLRIMDEIFSRINQSTLQVIFWKRLLVTEAFAQRFYEEHEGKPFFEGTAKNMSSGDILVMVLQGEDAVQVWRSMIGSTNPRDAAPGTIRRDLGVVPPEGAIVFPNLVHGSSSVAAALREIALFESKNYILK